MSVCFLDTETTGLHPDRHAIWEVALITPDDAEHVWQFPVDEMAADPFALNIGHYWERRWSTENDVPVTTAIWDAHTPKARRQHFPNEGRAVTPGQDWCRYFRSLTAGFHLAGAVVSFDEERLRRLLERNGVLHRWHYHLIDVEALAVGWLAAGADPENPRSEETHIPELDKCAPPWNSTDLSLAVGINPEDFDRHTALGDARWAKAIYEAVMYP